MTTGFQARLIAAVVLLTLISWARPAAAQPMRPPRDEPSNPIGTLGGVVVDQNDKPLAGATVALSLWHVKGDNGGRVAAGPTAKVRADDQGRWQMQAAPAPTDLIRLGASHPECLSESGHIETQEFKDRAGLVAGKATIRLHRGIPIEGLVRDPEGNPVKGATVAFGKMLMGPAVAPEVRSNDDGTFRLGVPPNIEAVLTVRAPGLAPQLKQWKMGNEPVKVTFDLKVPQMLTGTIVGSDGQPVAGATVHFDGWGDTMTLYEHVTTDDAGRFVWDGAPEGEIAARASAPGYRGSNAPLHLKAGEENLITLSALPSTAFKGKVVDAATGAAVASFSVTRGIAYDGQRVHWIRGDDIARPGAGAGEFDLDLRGGAPTMMVRVEAEGYRPADSAPVKLGSKVVEFTFKLEQGTAIEGTLLGTDGKPMPAVEVCLVEAGPGPLVINYGRRENDQHDFAHATTDAAGRFKIPPPPGSYTLLVTQPDGVAVARQADFEKTHTLTMQKWGRIEGQAKLGTQIMKNAIVSASSTVLPPEKPGEDSLVSASEQVKVDEAGKFVLEHVFPGQVSVGLTVTSGARAGHASDRTTVAVKPGETVQVPIGD